MNVRRQAGFTLIEVLVALGMVALALLAGLRASAALSDNAQRQATLLLGQLCAENELARLRLARQLPGVGDHTSGCEQGGRRLDVTLAVRPTPNPNFLRAEVRVSDAGVGVLQLATVLGRY